MTYLTPIERSVLVYAAMGLRDRHISKLVGKSLYSVSLDMRKVLVKLGARNRTQAVAIAIRQGIIR